MNPCECKNDNFLCHAKEGCLCNYGFTGENCTQLVSAATVVRNIEVSSQTNTGSIIAGCFVAIIIIGALIAYVYHRRRVVNLKTEIAHVQYIAEQQGFNSGTGT